MATLRSLSSTERSVNTSTLNIQLLVRLTVSIRRFNVKLCVFKRVWYEWSYNLSSLNCTLKFLLSVGSNLTGQPLNRSEHRVNVNPTSALYADHDCLLAMRL